MSVCGENLLGDVAYGKYGTTDRRRMFPNVAMDKNRGIRQEAENRLEMYVVCVVGNAGGILGTGVYIIIRKRRKQQGVREQVTIK